LDSRGKGWKGGQELLPFRWARRAQRQSRAPDHARRLRLDEALSWIVEAALKNRQKQFVIDGEVVILGVDGIFDFNALHSGKSDHEVQLYAFDVLAMDGDDLRPMPLSMRKASLAKLLHRRPDSIFTGSFEQGEIGEKPATSRVKSRAGNRGLTLRT
jgi:hypothetical protein